MIANFAACDRENFGDLLYPVILNMLLKKFGCSENLQAFAFLEDDAPGSSSYNVSNINDFLYSPRPSILVIGGGDCIRSDKKLLASHYSHIYSTRLSVARWPFRWLTNMLGVERDFTDEFIERFMQFSELAPYAIKPSRYSGVSKTVYMSVGVPFGFSDNEKSEIKNAFDEASFIYVRDRLSKQKLINAV